MYTYTCMLWCTGQTEDNFLSLILLFYQMGPMDQTQAVTLLSKSFWPLRNLAKPDFTYFCHVFSNCLS